MRNDANYCGFWKGHNWSKWTEFGRSEINRSDKPSGGSVGIAIYQERMCETCGFKEISNQTVML